MKKKLFAFALACVAFGSDAASSSAQGSFISQDAFTKSISHSRQTPNLNNHLNLYSIVDRGLTIFDNVCGGYELLLSRAHELQQTQSHSPDAAALSNRKGNVSVEIRQERPPTLEPPKSSDSFPTHPDIKSRLQGYVNAALSSIENGALSRFQQRILQTTPSVIERIYNVQNATINQATKLLAKSYTSLQPNLDSDSADALQTEAATDSGLLLATDPIRSRSLLEEYQAYDLSFHDRLWIQRMHHQHQSAEPTSEDLEILDSFIAASDAMCSATSPNRIAATVPSESVSPISKIASGTSYFVRKIPIDYSISTVPKQIQKAAPEKIDVATATVGDTSSRKLSNIFGNHIVPFVDFNSSTLNNLSIRWSVSPVAETESLSPETLAYSPLPMLDDNDLHLEQAKEISRDVSRLLRGAAKVAIRDLRFGLSRMQNWLDRVEVALAEQPADAKVAASNSARTNE